MKMEKKGKEFNNILDDCLERIISGEAIESCLSDYPENADELEPLLRTAFVTKESSSVLPDPEFRERAGLQFQAAIGELAPVKSRGFFGWQRQWVTAVAVIVFLLVVGSGTVVAAGNSMPDEPLYQVKLATESVRLALAPSDLDKAELYVKLADERIAEITEMANEGNIEEVEQTALRLNTQLVAIASLTAPEGAEMASDTLQQSDDEPLLLNTGDAPPVPAEEAPRFAVLETPEAVTGEADQPGSGSEPAPVEETQGDEYGEAPVSTTKEAPVVTAPQPLLPSLGAGSGITDTTETPELDEETKLKNDLSIHVINNQIALQTLLDKVPESVKPTLQQAIEITATGYEQALSNLQ